MKKWVAMVVGIVLVAGFVVGVVPVAAEGEPVLGDLNGDGRVNSQDLVIMKRIILGIDGGGDEASVVPSEIPSEVPIVFNNAEEVEAMTDEMLLALYAVDATVTVSGFHVPDDCGVPFKQGEYWLARSQTSASSRAEAESELEESFWTDCAYIGETEYYYVFRQEVTGDTGDSYAHRFIIYKDGVKHCEFNGQTGLYLKIRALDKQSVLDLLDIEVFFDHVQWSSAHVLYREMEENDDGYVYTYYTVYTVFGDWGLYDTAMLIKGEIRISKTTGEHSHLRGFLNPLKEVTIPGTYHPY